VNPQVQPTRTRARRHKGRYCAFCGKWFVPDHNRTRYCLPGCRLKAIRLKERQARHLKLKNLERAERDAHYAARRERHRLRMETVRVVRGVEVQPGFDLCKRTDCDVIFPVEDLRQEYCCDRCRGIAGNRNRSWRKKANVEAVEARKPIARRAVGLTKEPDLTDEPLMRGLALDEGVDGQLPWEHSWSGADPLPT